MDIIEIIFSGFVSKVVNDTVDITKEKIKKIIRDRKNQNFNTRIYRVIEHVLNTVTYDKYKYSDILYDATEKLFRNFKNDGNSLNAVRSGLSVLTVDVSDDLCEFFINKFFDEICNDDYLSKKINFILQEQGMEYNKVEFQELNRRIKKHHAELINKIDSMTEIFSESIPAKLIEEKKFQNNKKEDYIKIWKNRLFLHQDNDERPITLADAFIMPDFAINRITKDIGNYCSGFPRGATLDQIIDIFVHYGNTSSMLITGVPGIGKSSITSWIATQYRNNDNCIILRFRDWKKKDLEKGLLVSICNTLNCDIEDLENKFIILDGFDEMKALNIRDKLLSAFYNDIKDFENFKCIITSRPAYVNSTYFANVIELKKFNIDKVEKFCKIITGKALYKKEKIKLNLEVLGIPVILYMAVMSNIDISENPTKPELYNRIFAEKGGIFDRFYSEGIGYSAGTQILRDPENIKRYLEFLRKVAFMMFENNNLSIGIEDCEVPELEFQGDLVSILEFPIKHLFEGTENNIEFIHKSIYEYFVSEYLFEAIGCMINKNKPKEELAGDLGRFMIKRIDFPIEIHDFLKFKVKGKLEDMFDIVSETFQLMLRDGMIYYTGECYKNGIDCEMNVFVNMLDFLHLWGKEGMQFDPQIRNYLIYSKGIKVNLSKTNLNNVNLMEVDLSRKDLRGANLKTANLIRADLRDADFEGMDISQADLLYTIFDEKQINYLKGKCNLMNARVYVFRKNEVINYSDFVEKEF